MISICLWLAAASLLQGLWFIPLWLFRHRLERSVAPKMAHRLWLLALFGMTVWPVVVLFLPRAQSIVPIELSKSAALAEPSVSLVQVASWPQWIMGLWVICVLLLLGRVFVEYVRIEKLMQGSSPLKGIQAQRLHFWVKRFAIGRAVSGRLVSGIKSPFTMGLTRSQVVYPENAPWLVHRDDFDAITCHELAHIERRDVMRLTLAYVAASVFVFNPLVWLAMRRVRETAEWCCDSRALEAGVQPRRYANLLIQMLSWQRSKSGWSPLPAMAHDSNTIKRRLTMIIRPKPNSARLTACLALVCFGLQGVIWLPQAPVTIDGEDVVVQERHSDEDLNERLARLEDENRELRQALHEAQEMASRGEGDQRHVESQRMALEGQLQEMELQRVEALHQGVLVLKERAQQAQEQERVVMAEAEKMQIEHERAVMEEIKSRELEKVHEDLAQQQLLLKHQQKEMEAQLEQELAQQAAELEKIRQEQEELIRRVEQKNER